MDMDLSPDQRRVRARKLAERAAQYSWRCENLEHRLHSRGVHDTTASNVALCAVNAPYDTDADRYAAWCLESLLTAYRALGAQGCRVDPPMAFRCMLQASDYAGRLRGYWPDGSGDYSLEIRCAIEALL